MRSDRNVMIPTRHWAETFAIYYASGTSVGSGVGTCGICLLPEDWYVLLITHISDIQDLSSITHIYGQITQVLRGNTSTRMDQNTTLVLAFII